MAAAWWSQPDEEQRQFTFGGRRQRDPRRYLPVVYTHWEGTEFLNYSPFVYAYQQNNTAITGSGTLDGQCDCEHWWPWKGRTDYGWAKGQSSQQNARNALMAMGEKGVPLEDRKFGEGYYLRPNFIQPFRSTNVLIVTCQQAKYALYARSFEGAPIRGIHLKNCKFRKRCRRERNQECPEPGVEWSYHHRQEHECLAHSI